MAAHKSTSKDIYYYCSAIQTCTLMNNKEDQKVLLLVFGQIYNNA